MLRSIGEAFKNATIGNWKTSSKILFWILFFIIIFLSVIGAVIIFKGLKIIPIIKVIEKVFRKATVGHWHASDKISFWSLIILTLGSFIALIQLGKEINRRKKEDKRRYIENATKLAKYYAEEIMPRSRVLYEVFSRRQIRELKYKFKYTIREKNLIHFDEVEFEKINPKLKKKWKRVLPRSARQGKWLRIFKSKDYVDRHTQIYDLLNRLEYFSMELMANISDEKALYPSLHITFLETVSFLYYEISRKNKTQRDKLFVHIIKLFNIWRLRQEKDEKNENSEREKEIRQEIKNPLS